MNTIRTHPKSSNDGSCYISRESSEEVLKAVQAIKKVVRAGKMTITTK